MSIPILMNAQQGELDREVDEGEDRSDAWGSRHEGGTKRRWQEKSVVWLSFFFPCG